MSLTRKRRVFLVDDQQVFVKGLRALLEKGDGRIEVVGTALSGEEAIEKIRGLAASTPVDVAVLDAKMPGLGGIETTRVLRKEHPDLRIIILTTFNEGQFLADGFRAGADGFLLKDEDEEGITTAILDVNPRHFLISRDSFSEYLRHAPIQNDRSERSKVSRLSSKHQEVFYLLIHGKDNREISEELFLTEKTVRNYVSHIYETLGVAGRAQVIVWAEENGLR